MSRIYAGSALTTQPPQALPLLRTEFPQVPSFGLPDIALLTTNGEIDRLRSLSRQMKMVKGRNSRVCRCHPGREKVGEIVRALLRSIEHPFLEIEEPSDYRAQYSECNARDQFSDR